MELPPAGRRGSFLLVAPLLVIAILLEQLCLVRFFPWLGEMGGIQPMIIFLDIPLRLPMIDWIPVGIIFVFFYLVVVAPELSRYRSVGAITEGHGGSLYSTPSRGQYYGLSRGQYYGPSRGQLLRKQGWGVFTGWWVLLIFLIMAGGLYYLIEEQLPRQIRNGIDSFGIRADIALPYPLEGVLHLHGGMLMFIALLFGGRFLLRQARLPLLAQPIANTVPPIVVEERAPRVIVQERAPQLAVEESAPPVHKPKPVRSVYVQTPDRSAYTPASDHPAYLPADRVCKHSAYLPPEPVPVKVRPCVVNGVLEPSFKGVLEPS